MKSIIKFFLLLSSIALFSCTEEAFIEGTPSKGLTAQIPSYQFENQTRVNISPNLSTFTWSDGDKIGIYYTSGITYADAKFTLKQAGSSQGEFYNEAFSLKPNSTYYAFYPYDSDATVDSFPVDFTGQIQTANGSTAHIGARNYMSAVVNTDDSGAANIAFQNLAAVIQAVIPIEEVGIYTGVTLSTAAADFITQGTLNMKTGDITPTEKSQQMGLSFGKGLALNEGDELVANFLVAPTDLSGKSLTIQLTERNGATLSAPGYGKKIEKGKAYRFESGEMNEIPYLTFTAGTTQTLSMSKAVETIEYSVNGGDWQELGTITVTFGGAKGNLRLRGKSSKGTANSFTDYSEIYFGNDAKVACSGDIRTLVDYENYKATNTKNARFCYLFYGCSNLTSAPSLPATTLADYCYRSMFMGCSSLTSAPSLPATTLAWSCYTSMFRDCTSLTSAPSLPATTLASYCYRCMFEGCTSLTSAPSLPATTLATQCYFSMFSGCSSLTSAPSSLPAETLADYCYHYMFMGCSSLTSAPSLPATTLATSCYYEMFNGCSNLTSAPSLPATTLASSCYSGMFYGCSSLTSAPSLPATTLADNCYSYMFVGCTSLTSAPSLPATTLADNCYYGMFIDCSSLTSAPSLPAETLASYCYRSMFMGCSSLMSAPSLPATTLATSCYTSMFRDCTSLTSAPSLPAPILAESCYEYMFNGCSKLNYIKMMATDISATDCLKNWTEGVASTGIFVKNAAATWNSSYAVPSGWTVQTATK